MMTLLECIEQIERQNFRTESDLGANPAALVLWNRVRERAGLPRLRRADLTTAAEYTDRSRDAIGEREYPLMPRTQSGN
jgi:hypothetical protein